MKKDIKFTSRCDFRDDTYKLYTFQLTVELLNSELFSDLTIKGINTSRSSWKVYQNRPTRTFDLICTANYKMYHEAILNPAAAKELDMRKGDRVTIETLAEATFVISIVFRDPMLTNTVVHEDFAISRMEMVDNKKCFHYVEPRERLMETRGHNRFTDQEMKSLFSPFYGSLEHLINNQPLSDSAKVTGTVEVHHYRK